MEKVEENQNIEHAHKLGRVEANWIIIEQISLVRCPNNSNSSYTFAFTVLCEWKHWHQFLKFTDYSRNIIGYSFKT